MGCNKISKYRSHFWSYWFQLQLNFYIVCWECILIIFVKYVYKHLLKGYVKNSPRRYVHSGHGATAFELASVTLAGVYFLISFLKRGLKQALFYQKDLSRQHNYSHREYNKHNPGKVLGYIINNLHFQVVELCWAMFLESPIRNSDSFFLST